MNGERRDSRYSFYTNVAHVQQQVSPSLAHLKQQLSPCLTIAQPMWYNGLAHELQQNSSEYNRSSKYDKVETKYSISKNEWSLTSLVFFLLYKFSPCSIIAQPNHSPSYTIAQPMLNNSLAHASQQVSPWKTKESRELQQKLVNFLRLVSK